MVCIGQVPDSVMANGNTTSCLFVHAGSLKVISYLFNYNHTIVSEYLNEYPQILMSAMFTGFVYLGCIHICAL